MADSCFPKLSNDVTIAKSMVAIKPDDHFQWTNLCEELANLEMRVFPTVLSFLFQFSFTIGGHKGVMINHMIIRKPSQYHYFFKL